MMMPDGIVDWLQMRLVPDESYLKRSVLLIKTRADLNDPALGLSELSMICPTCHNPWESCMGHWGHIPLPIPIFRPLFLKHLVDILNCMCFYCQNLLVGPDHHARSVLEAMPSPGRMDFILRLKIKECWYCHKQPVEFAYNDKEFVPKIIVHLTDQDYLDYQAHPDTWTPYRIGPQEIYDALSFLSPADTKLMGLNEHNAPLHHMHTLIPVAPMNTRPAHVLEGQAGGKKAMPNDWTKFYKLMLDCKIALDTVLQTYAERGLSTSINLCTYTYRNVSCQNGNHHKILSIDSQTMTRDDAKSREKAVKVADKKQPMRHDELHTRWLSLQSLMAAFVSKAHNQRQLKTGPGKYLPRGTVEARYACQKLGRFRMNVTAGRTDNNARCVLSDDMHQHPTRLGVPYGVAMRLTVKVRVTCDNVKKAQEWILNGPFTHPGANFILTKDGTEVDLSYYENRRTIDMDKVEFVFRHLQSGDWVLGNRQPTIHRHSMIAFQVRLTHNHTIDIHQSLLPPLAGEFDGDEFNLFLFVGYLAQGELACLAPATQHLMKDGKILIKFIQNSVMGLYLMTATGVFFNREDAMSLVAAVSDTQWTLPPPAILKPIPMWTGKQLVSLFIPSYVHIGDRSISTNSLLIVDGELLQGQLTDSALNGSNGILQAIVRDGPSRLDALDFIHVGYLMAQYYLDHHEVVTAGYYDVAEDPQLEESVKHLTNHPLTECVNKRASIQALADKANAYTDGLGAYVPGDNVAVERSISDLVNGIQEQYIQYTKKYLTTLNDMFGRTSAMVVAVESGAKSSWPSLAQMLCHMGQVYTQKGRYPAAAPYFIPGKRNLEAFGLIVEGLSRGLSPSAVMAFSPPTTESVHQKNSGTAGSGYVFRIMSYACMSIQTNMYREVKMGDNVIWNVYGGDGYDPQWMGHDRVRLVHIDETEIVSRYAICPWDMDRVTHETLIPKQWAIVAEENLLSPPSALDWRPYLTVDVGDEWVYVSQEHNMSNRKVMQDELLNLLSLQRQIRTFWCTHLNSDNLSLIKSPFQMPVIFRRCVSEVGSTSCSNVLPLHAVQFSKELWAYLVSEKLVLDTHLPLKALFFDWFSAYNLIRVHRFTWAHLIWLGKECVRRCARVVVAPGEGVGPYAAQNVGEPYTQNSLKATHASGKQLTSVSGTKRMFQLIQNSHTHSTMSIILMPGCTARDAYVLGMSITRCYLSDVCRGFPVTFTGSTECVISFSLHREKMIHRVIGLHEIVHRLVKQTSLTYSMFDMPDQMSSESWVLRLYIPYASDFWQYFDRSVGTSSSRQVRAGCVAQNLYSNVLINGLPEIETFITDEVTFSRSSQRKEQRHRVMTQGTSLGRILCLPNVDVTLSTSTDVSEMQSVFGILAARQALLIEFQQVMGSMVDSRHLELFMRAMTGARGIESMKVNQTGRRLPPLLRMSFESFMKQAVDVAVRSAKDNCNTVPASVLAHRPIRAGTGYNIQVFPLCRLDGLVRAKRRSFCPYVFSPKADGLRMTLILTTQTYDNKRLAVLADRSSFHTLLPVAIESWPESVFNGTVIDGELIMCPHLNRPLFLVFDCYSICGNRCNILRYDHRLELAREVVHSLTDGSDLGRMALYAGMEYLMKGLPSAYPARRPELSTCARPVKGSLSNTSSAWYMLVKPIFDMSGLHTFPLEAFPWDKDGFVFTNVTLAATPFRMERDTFMKWKPAEHITIDFVAQSYDGPEPTGSLATLAAEVSTRATVFERADHLFREPVCHSFRVFTHGTHSLWVELPGAGSQCFSLATCLPDIQVRPGDIVECQWTTSPFPQWVIRRVRLKTANDWSTVVPTLQNIVDSINITDFPVVEP